MQIATTPDNQADTHSDRIAELDGFRAIAIAMVFVSHMMKGWPNSTEESAIFPRWLFSVLDHGWLGVDLFFLLSGLLITGILIDTRGREHYFRNFYVRRTLRIFPLYFTCIAILYFAFPGYGSYFAMCVFMLQNFVHGFGIPTPHGPGVFWSLAVEEHFYLIWPWIVRYCSNRATAWIAALVVFLTPFLRGYFTSIGYDIDGQIYVYSWFRFDGLCLGALLALWMRSRYFTRTHAVRIAAACCAVFLLITIAGYPFGVLRSQTVASGALRYTQAQFLFAIVLVLALAWQGSQWTSPLRHPVAIFIASISYCAYLIHVNLGEAYYGLLGSLGLGEVALFGIPGSLFARTAFVLIATLTIAYLSREYLEKPILKLKRYF